MQRTCRVCIRILPGISHSMVGQNVIFQWYISIFYDFSITFQILKISLTSPGWKPVIQMTLPGFPWLHEPRYSEVTKEILMMGSNSWTRLQVLSGTQPVSTQARLSVHTQVNKQSRTNHRAWHALLSRSCSSMYTAVEAAQQWVRAHKLLSINNRSKCSIAARLYWCRCQLEIYREYAADIFRRADHYWRLIETYSFSPLQEFLISWQAMKGHRRFKDGCPRDHISTISLFVSQI